MAEKLNIYELDKFDPNDFFIPLNFSLADFRDISTRNGYYSKTIEIPSTKKNDSLLGQSFDISAEGFFDRNKRQKAFIERDGITYLDGFMQLKSVELKNGKPYKYKIVLFSNLSEWASEIGDAKITDLDYSTIVYNQANIEASWDTEGISDEYVFPAINYENFTGSDSTTNITVEDFLPAIYVYYIMRKSFENVGYQLKPGIFNDKRFGNLIIPSTVTETTRSKQFMEDNDGGMFISSQGGGYIFTIPASTGFGDLNFDTFNTDSNTDNFTLIGGSFTAPFDCTVSASVKAHITNLQNISDNNVEVAIRKVEFSSGITTVIATQTINIANGFGAIFDLNISSLDLLENDIIKVSMKSGNNFNTELATAFPNPTTFDVDILSAPLTDGSNIGVGDFLPDMKQIDLIKAVTQMFNLYHVTDERSKTVEFLTRDEFYKNISEADDWTDNVDYSKSIEIEQLDRNLARELEFKYIYDSNDDFQVAFRDDYGVTYADYTETLDNEFLKDSKTVADIPFAPSFGSGTIDQPDGSYIDIPYIKTNYNTGGDPIEVQNRILVYGGLVDLDWTFESSSKTQLPYSYFTKLSSDFSDLSLSFRSYKNLSRAIRTEDRGLFERFYANQVRMFNEGRLVTMYLKLSPLDILNLDFRKPKLIDGVYYYLNKIEDYKTGTSETTKVELINIP